GAISMLVELERSFNQIYGASSGRSWVKRVTTYWTTLTLGIVFLLATFSVGDAAGNWVASLVSGDGGGWLSRGVVEFTVNIVINTLLLLLAYSTVPNTRVHIRPALAGAAVAGIAWEIGKIGFTQYVRHAVGGLEQLYGVLALLPLFMLWVYITWIIVLFGLQVSYTLQTFGASRDEQREVSSTDPVDPALVLTIAKLADERFRAGKTLRIDDAVGATGVGAAAIERLVRGLVEGGVLHEVEEGDERAWVLARPAETIKAEELLAIGRCLRQGGVRGGAVEIDRALDRSLHGVVLSSLDSGGDGPDMQGETGEPSGRASG
ncbi:MAG TPA: YihY family inner membrane protein, partial [Phycisphaerales bacterium]|nr:YihY family inner membrane protein [Phycisphaerales bacterium]